MKLYRPHIPLRIRCIVAGAQLLAHGVNVFAEFSREEGETRAALLERRLARLADILGCTRAELRLDHNPALGLRKRRRTGKTIMVGGEPVDVLIYSPGANDPAHLLYRSHHAHLIKTNLRGDGAQFSDTALMKRERRRKKKRAKIERKKSKQKLVTGLALRGRLAKLTSARPIPIRHNPWGAKGSRPFRRL